jgi:hypothetical protein
VDRISSLTKKPPSGGIPLIEKIVKAKIIARIGFEYFSEEKCVR